MINYPVASSPPALPSATSSPKRLSSPFKPHLTNLATPVAKRQRIGDGDEEETEIFADTEDVVQQRLHGLSDGRFDDGDVTSSAVKGRAASGLLELMKGQR